MHAKRRVNLRIGANDVAARRIAASKGRIREAGRMTESIDQCVKPCPNEVQQTLQPIRAVVRKPDPEAGEKTSWEIRADYLNGNVAHVEAFKNNVGLCRRSSMARAFEYQLRKN
jgi:hypothetical protein